MKITKALVPLLGYDLGLLPATKSRPKEMLPLIDKTILDLAVDDAVAAGIEEIVVVTRFNDRSIKNHLDGDFELEHLLECADEKRDKVYLGCVHSDRIRVTYVPSKRSGRFWDMLSPARNSMSGEPFAVILPGDVMFSDRSVLKTLVDLYESHQAAAIALTGEPTAKPHESESSIEGLWQSVCLGSGVYRLGPQALDEATTAAHLTIAGRLVLDPTFFDYVEPPDDDDVRHQLERTVRCYAKQNTVMGLLIHDKCVRVETRMDYLVATVEAGLRQPDVGVEFANYLSKVRDEN